MLGQVLNALGTGSVTIRLSPSKALSAVPFGAVNARVGPNLIRSSDYYEVLNGLLSQVRAGFEVADKVFLMVDNGEFIDEQSAAVIMQVVMSTEVKLILVDQPGSQRTYLRELWRDGHLARFELASLKSADVQAFLEDVLDGKVSSPAADYLASRSAGNPLVLKGLVSGALEEGSLQKVDGVWMLDHPADKLGAESSDFLRMELDHLRPESRRIIDILALAGPLPLDVLLEVTSTESVDDIQQRELVAIVPGPAMTMQLARPATAGPIRRMIPVGRSRRLLAEVTEVYIPGDTSEPEVLINFTRWAVDCGVPVSDEQILAAATKANHLVRVQDALHISSQYVSPEFEPALLAQQSLAQLNNDRADTARALAARSLELAVTPDVGADALRAIHAAHLPEQDFEAKFGAALDAYEEKFGVVRLDGNSTRADFDVLTLRASAEVTLGESATASARIAALLAHPLADNPVDQTHLKSLLCEVLTTTGRTGPAAALAGEVVAVLERPEGFPRPDISILAYTRAVSAFIYNGDWEIVRRALAPAVFTNPDLMLHSGGMKDLGAAMMHCRRGHIDEALAVLGPAVAALMDYDPWLVLPTALGLQAYCMVMRGDTDGVHVPLKRLEGMQRRGNTFHHLEAAAYAAAARAMSGHRILGVKQLYALLHECRDRGYTGTELTVLSLLIRVGENGVVPRMVEVSDLVESGTKAFFQEWSRALRSQDPVTLDRASTTAVEYGFELVAVELATQAQKRFNDGGKVHRSRKTASKVVSMREQLPGLASPAFTSIDRPKMTRREHEIASLVAKGESNNAIAERLNVSLRTVEGHLYRTFIKLDLQSREQLARLMNEGSNRTPAGASIN
ncbi:MAG: helix-turn-helix transcriptional regulator [Specibacter sp.]